MRPLGWSPGSKGPAPTGGTGLGAQPGPEGRPHERGPRGGPSGAPGPQAAIVHAHLWALPCRPGQMGTASRAERRGRSHLEMVQPHKARVAGGPACISGESRQGEGGRGREEQARPTTWLGLREESGTGFFSLTGKISSNWALSKHPLVA